MMSRIEAICHFSGLSDQVDLEYCVGKKESDALTEETRQAFLALGVSDAEQESAFEL